VGEEEIAFLALHVGAYLQKTLDVTDRVRVTCVAPRYYDVQDSVVRRLEAHLGEAASIAETITSLDHDWSTIQADLVVSTVELPVDMPSSVIVISPVPTRADLDRVTEAVRAARARKVASRIRWTLSELLDPRLYFHVPSTTKMEALEMMCGHLIDEGIAPATFLQDVLERERLSPTAFGGAIAIPHSMKMDSKRTAISILVSDQPIAWAESKVQLVAMFALSPNGRHVFRDVLDQFIAALSEPVRIADLVANSQTYDIFVHRLVEQLQAMGAQ
jgi:lichenan operon transcriptional antiterminator